MNYIISRHIKKRHQELNPDCPIHLRTYRHYQKAAAVTKSRFRTIPHILKLTFFEKETVIQLFTQKEYKK